MRNEYLPHPARIEAIRRESQDVKTFRVHFKEEDLAASFDYRPGQFCQVGLLGVGECPISISSSPTQRGYLEFTIKLAGKVTGAIHKLEVGDEMFVRGPYGKGFPFEEAKGKDLYFIAGGIGLAPLRSLINTVLRYRDDFGRLKILYGARTPDALCFKDELRKWGDFPDVEVLLTVDVPDESWRGNVGVVTTLWDKTEISGEDAVAYVCGPPIMMKFVVRKLMESGFEEENVYLSLERYMKCGIGKCGHCAIGGKFVCTDGPVFSYRQIKRLPRREVEL